MLNQHNQVRIERQEEGSQAWSPSPDALRNGLSIKSIKIYQDSYQENVFQDENDDFI